MTSRLYALNILEDHKNQFINLESAINQQFSKGPIDHRDKRLIFEIVYGVLRNKLSLDYTLHSFLHEKRIKENDLLMNILRIGMYQIVYLDRIPDHAAVFESVRLAKIIKKCRNYSGLVNAVLRKIVNEKKRLPKPHLQEKLSYRLAIMYSHPEWLVQKWLDNFGLSNTKKILAFNNEPPQIFIRRKMKGLSRQQFEILGKDVFSNTKSVSGYKNLFYILKKSIIPEEFKLLKDGYCTVQSVSSGWVIALLDIKKGDKLLDICSAPGGKASFLAELSGDQGAVCACDLSFNRLQKVGENADRMGLTNIFNIVCDGCFPPFNGQFDKILLDAPCSGTGILHRHPDARWRKTPEGLNKIIAKQKKLLDAIAPYVVPNGILVYATCSLEREENRLQIENFLKDHPEFILEKPYNLIKDTFIDAHGYLNISPYEHNLDAMFAARLRKISS